MLTWRSCYVILIRDHSPRQGGCHPILLLLLLYRSNEKTCRLLTMAEKTFLTTGLALLASAGAGFALKSLMASDEKQGKKGVSTKTPVSVCVTGAAGQIGYSLVFMIAQGQLLDDTPIELRLLDLPVMAGALEGLKMELLDGAFPLLTDIICCTDYKTAFQNLDVAMLVGARPRGPGMERKDLLKANASIFSGQGKALNDYAKKTVKVLVVGNPANTNALIAKTYAPDIPAQNFTAMTRLDQNRAQSQIAAKLGVRVGQVKGIVVWGNHSSTQFPDVNHAHVVDYPSPGKVTSVRDAIGDDNWLDTTFLKTVCQRGAAVIEARGGKSSAASAATAAVNHVHDWLCGSGGEVVSMGVPSDGSYGIPPGLIFSFPVKTTPGGNYTIVTGLPQNDFANSKLNTTLEELQGEKKDALGSPTELLEGADVSPAIPCFRGKKASGPRVDLPRNRHPTMASKQQCLCKKSFTNRAVRHMQSPLFCHPNILLLLLLLLRVLASKSSYRWDDGMGEHVERWERKKEQG
eukprot:g55981.t1